MGPDLDAAGTVLRCPTCSAAVRAGAPWCTQCYVDLRPPAAAFPAPPVSLSAEPTLSPAAPDSSPAAPASSLAEPTVPSAAWPCAACGTANGLDSDACAACGAGFLSGLRATEPPLLVLPVVGDLGALTRSQRLGLAAAVVLAVVVLTAVLGLLLS